MKNKLRLSTKLYLLFIFMAFFIFSVGYYGIIGMKTMDNNTHSFYYDRMLPLHQLTQIRYSYVNDILNLVEKLKFRKIQPEQAKQQIEIAEKIIDDNWKAYLKTYFTPEEVQLVKQITVLKAIADKAIAELKQQIEGGDISVGEIDEDHVLAKVNPVTGKINELVELQVKVSHQLHNDNEQLYNSTKNKLYLIILASLLFSYLIGFFIIRDTRKFIKDRTIHSSERKKAQLAIQESEEKYRYLFQNSPAYIIIWDLERLCVLEVNDKVVSKYGYTRDEWINMPVVQYRPIEDHEKIRNFAQSMLRGNEPVSTRIWRHLKKNGELMYMEIASHKFIYQGHKAILSLGNDVTEQLKVQAELRKSEENFHSLVDHAADGIFMVTDKGIITNVNRSGAELLQYTKEEIIGKSSLEFQAPETRKYFHTSWGTLKKEKALINEGVLQRKDGTTVPVEISRKMLPDKSGTIAIVRDITIRKQLEEQHLLMSSIVNSSDDAIISTTLEGIVTTWNKGAENVLGYAAKEIVGRNMSTILPSDLIDEQQEILKNIKAGKSVVHYETQRIKNDGTTIFVSLSISPITDSQGNVTGASKILRDITESKLYEQKLTRASIKAQENERYEIGGELHDNVCQILASSLMFLGLLKRSLPSESIDYFDKTKRYIILATNEIRNLSHRLAPAFFDDATLEDAFNHLLKEFNAENKYDIRLSFDKDAKAYPLSRDLQLNLYRILQEQLRNIVKHAKATSIEVKVTIESDTLQMRINDNGIGFDANTSKGGIGLANMARRVQLFSGKIRIDSTVSNGCEVVIDIPLKSIFDIYENK